MRTILIFLVCTVCLSVETAPLPPSTTTATKAYDQAVTKAKEAYNKAEAEARRAYLAALNQALNAETKKGNLEGAIAIRDKIKDLTTVADSSIDALGNVHWANSLVGTKWDCSAGGYIEFRENWKALFSESGKATWEIVDHKKISITYGGHSHAIVQNADGTMTATRDDGITFNMKKRQGDKQ